MKTTLPKYLGKFFAKFVSPHHCTAIRTPFVFSPIPVFARSLTLLTPLCLAGCGPSGPREVRNDDYEKPSEPDYGLRQLLGVRTLRAEFEMPQGMRTFRVGLIYIVDGQVTASEWLSGNGLHTVHSDGTREFAKTLYVEYMNGKFDGEWKERLHVTPSFTTRSHQTHGDFWQHFKDADLRTQGWTNAIQNEKFGDFRILAATYGSKENVASGPVESLLQNMDFLALLVVDFLPEKMNSNERMVEFPSEGELQGGLEGIVGGER